MTAERDQFGFHDIPVPDSVIDIPTAERDRLIDVLQEAWLLFVADDTPGDEFGQLADRLIAAGVVLMDEERLRQIATDMYHGGAKMEGDLDVERLARALRAGYLNGSWYEHESEAAAAIAVAYREDAGSPLRAADIPSGESHYP